MKSKLLSIKKKQSGRDSAGHVSVRHRGGEHKRFIRLIDWQRSKIDIIDKVTDIQYDTNRTDTIDFLT